MSYPVLQERDVFFHDLTSRIGISSCTPRGTSMKPNVVTSGLVAESFNCFSVNPATVDLAASMQIAAGCLIRGPELGEDHTLYSVTASAGLQVSGVVPYVFVGMSTLTPTATTSGQTVIFCSILAFGDAVSSFGRVSYEGTVAVPNLGIVDRVDRSNNPLVFGFAFVAGASNPPRGSYYGHLSVQRLVSRPPRLIDRRRR